MAVGVLVWGITAESDRKHEEFLAQTDAFIERIEKEHANDENLQAYKKKIAEQAAVENETVQEVSEQAPVYVTEPETYCDPLTVEYETDEAPLQINTEESDSFQLFYGGASEGMGYEDFYEAYQSVGEVSWNDCMAAAQETMGMDEYSLLIAAGWTVNEGYVWYDPYLAYLCAMCPWHYFVTGQDMADGLAGWDYTGTYSEGNLVWLGSGIGCEDLKILYLAIKHPYYCIYGCDGLSWYGTNYIYESFVNGYTIRVWSY